MPSFTQSPFAKARVLVLDTPIAAPTAPAVPAPLPVEPPPSLQSPRELRPQLFLVEHYLLSTFRGDLSRDDLLATVPPVMPHTELRFKIISKRKTSEERLRSCTALDSQSEESSQSFNESIHHSASAKFGKNKYDYSMNGSFHGEASVGFFEGSADADVKVEGSTNEVRSEMANSVSSAIDTQVSQASQARRERVSIGTEHTVANQETETETMQVTRNDSDDTWNFAVFQVKEELISILSLVNVEVAFRNTDAAADLTVPLFNLDSLLERTLAAADQRTLVKERVRKVLEAVRDHEGQKRSLLSSDQGAVGELRVNRRLTSTYELRKTDGTLRRTISVPGVIVSSYRRFIPKQGATVLLPITR
jgi:hypothetical protein